MAHNHWNWLPPSLEYTTGSFWPIVVSHNRQQVGKIGQLSYGYHHNRDILRKKGGARPLCQADKIAVAGDQAKLANPPGERSIYMRLLFSAPRPCCRFAYPLLLLSPYCNGCLPDQPDVTTCWGLSQAFTFCSPCSSESFGLPRPSTQKCRFLPQSSDTIRRLLCCSVLNGSPAKRGHGSCRDFFDNVALDYILVFHVFTSITRGFIDNDHAVRSEDR